MPSTSDIPNATDSRSIRATTAAASAISRTLGLPTEPMATPWIGRRRIVRDPGQAGGHHPHEGVHPVHRDAEERGPVGGLGRRPHRDAEP